MPRRKILNSGGAAVMTIPDEQPDRRDGGGFRQAAARHEEEPCRIGYSDRAGTGWFNGSPERKEYV